MPLRFQQHISLFPGVRLNLSRSGMSVSVGVPGATLNFGGRAGTAVTVGIPGTGLSYRHQLGSTPQNVDDPSVRTPPPPKLAPDFEQGALPGEIRSASVSTLTTPDLEGLKRLLNDAVAQRRDSQTSVAKSLKARDGAWRALERARKLPLKPLLSSKVPRLEASFQQTQTLLEEEVAKLNACYVQVDFAFDWTTLDAYNSLIEAHRELRSCQKIWDITSSVSVNRVSTRSSASESVSRRVVTLSDAKSGIVASKWMGLRFENANGADLELFPGFCLLKENSGDYALIDLRDINLGFEEVRFIEEDELPTDALKRGYVWEKSNKDGSPDRRFSNNRQLPVLLYGQLNFRTGQGLNEAYMVSNHELAKSFALAFTTLKNSLKNLSSQTADPNNFDSPQTLIEPASPYRIPDVPNTPGAHEYTMGAFAAVVALACWGIISLPKKPATSSLPPPKLVTPAPPAPAQQPPAGVQTAHAVATSGDAPAVAQQPTPAEQVVTLQRANLRAGPNATAAVIKTVAPGVVFEVFSRNTGWVQVGNEQPSGWINAALLGPTLSPKR